MNKLCQTLEFQIYANRSVGMSSTAGVISENNVTILHFAFDFELETDMTKSVIFFNNFGSLVKKMNNENSIVLSSDLLTDYELNCQLMIVSSDGKKWKSEIFTLDVLPALDDSGENVVEKAKSEQKEADRTELGETLSDLTGQDLRKSDWDELIDVANELPLKSEQDVLDLRKYSELTYAFAHATTPPSLITGGYKLDKEDPDDSESPDILIKLPFLETPNAIYTTATRVSASVEECGFSIGEASANTICKNEKSMFGIFAGTVPQNLKKLTLAGVERIPDTAHMFHSCSSIEELYLIEGENYAEGYVDNYYAGKFMYCSNLQSILGTPLDMSRGNNYNVCFTGCKKLRYIRFKPYSISHDLDLSECSGLMKGKYGASTDDSGTLLSIVNGVREYRSELGQITIKFSSFIKDYLTSWRCVKDDETGLYIAATQGMTLATVLTNYKGVIIA